MDTPGATWRNYAVPDSAARAAAAAQLPPVAPAGHPDRPRLVASPARFRGGRGGRGPRRDRDLQEAGGQALDQVLAPLHDGDRAVHVRVQVQVVDLGPAAQPVGVGVHQVRPAAQGRVHPGDDEGRRGHRAAHAQPGADALGQRRLARPERPGQDDQVTGAQQPGQALPQLAHPGRARHRDRLLEGRPQLLPASVQCSYLAARPGLTAQLPSAGQQRGYRLVDDLGTLQDDQVPGPGHQDQLGAGDARGQLARAPGGMSRSRSPVMTVAGTAPSVASAASWSWPDQGQVELGDHLDGRGPDDPLQEVHDGRAHAGVPEGHIPGGQERDVPGGLAAPLDHRRRPARATRRAAATGAACRATGRSGRRQPARRVDPGGGGGDEHGAGHPAAERGPNSRAAGRPGP